MQIQIDVIKTELGARNEKLTVNGKTVEWNRVKCQKVVELMQMAFNAALRGENLDFIMFGPNRELCTDDEKENWVKAKSEMLDDRYAK